MARKISSYKVTIGQGNLKKFLGNNLYLYTMVACFLVLAIYLGTTDWKGFTSPEEVDLGVVSVPGHMCRRKHKHHD